MYSPSDLPVAAAALVQIRLGVLGKAERHRNLGECFDHAHILAQNPELREGSERGPRHPSPKQIIHLHLPPRHRRLRVGDLAPAEERRMIGGGGRVFADDVLGQQVYVPNDSVPPAK